MYRHTIKDINTLIPEIKLKKKKKAKILTTGPR